jgi:hypothetical protein
MSARPPRFAIVDEAAASQAPTGFVRAVLRRIRPGLLPWALGALVAAQSMTQFNFAVRHFDVPHGNWRSMVLSDAVLIASVMLAVLAADEAVARGTRRWPTYLAALVVGCAFGAVVQWHLLMSVGWDNIIARLPQDMRAAQPLNRFFNWLLYSTLACFVYVNLRTARLAADRMRAAELARALSRRRTLESRLQAMQARVEPQFLFNTLAQVRELYERDADVASRVLDDLIAYLRAALPHLRESSSTLGQEITLARAYLDIMRIRLGKRLTFSIDVPEATKAARMPPMMLLPLIDHALVYGLQPADSSGTIRITTEAAAGRLRLAITDSGVAFLPDTHADGLDSIAQRLHALYGDQARFELERMRERGTRATLEIPYEDTDSRDR